MIVEQIPVGGDRNFSYLVGCPEHRIAAVFDPAYSPHKILEAAARLGVAVRYVVNTHGHHDHTNGNDAIIRPTGATVVAHPGCPVGAGIAVEDGQTLELGSLTLRALHTPGHTEDSISIVAGSAGREEIVVTGDTLFVGKIGGTSTEEEARAEYESLHRKLMRLADDVTVYPGHDVGVRPWSTIGDERRTNPFLLQPSFEAFLQLKQNWLQYKKEHGIA